MSYTVTYEPARPPCSGSCRPGTIALMRAVVESHPRLRSLGCYNCRNVRGSTSTLSVHAVGRATDVGFLAPADQLRHGGEAGAHLQVVCDALIEHYRTVGVQQIIYAARIWRVGSTGWRPFGGGSGDHHDHAHIELVSAAAETLDLNTVTGVVNMADLEQVALQVSELHRFFIGNHRVFEVGKPGYADPTVQDGTARINETAARVGASRTAAVLTDGVRRALIRSELTATARDAALARSAAEAAVALLRASGGDVDVPVAELADAIVDELTERLNKGDDE